MRDSDYRKWLDHRLWKGKPLEPSAKENRVARVLRVERQLAALGFPHPDLQSLYDAGSWSALVDRLASLRREPGIAPDAVRAVVPQSERPEGQLGNLLAAIKQYGYFLEGRSPSYGSEDDGDDDPQLFLVSNLLGELNNSERFLSEGSWSLSDAASEDLRAVLTRVQTGDILALREYLPNRRDLPFDTKGRPVTALRFLAIGTVIGKHADGLSLAVEWTVLPEPRLWYFYTHNRAIWQPPVGKLFAQKLRAFLLEGEAQDCEWFSANWWPARRPLDLDEGVLNRLRAQFLDLHPDFTTFATCESFQAEEGTYKRALAARAADIMAARATDDAAVLGAELLDLVAGRAGLTSNLLDWRTEKLAREARQANPGVMERATGELARADDGVRAVLAWVEEVWPLLEVGSPQKPYAESRTIPTMIRAMVDPAGVMGIRSTPTDNAAKMLTGQWAFASRPLAAEDLQQSMALADALLAEMRDRWRWEPRDYWDVQSFIWETCQKRNQPGAADSRPEEKIMNPTPTNLILYGPPGTGKTYRTAAEAVALCDGPSVTYPDTPAGRVELMARYAALVTEKRIGFVTFHQNFDYESFVEGLRPVTDNEGGAQAGFRLEPKEGIFRKMCALAEQAGASSGSAPASGPISFEGRRFWKMGQGAIGAEDEVYEDALARNYIALGWGGAIDWSPAQFSSLEAIKQEWLARNPDDVTPSNWTQLWPFRSEMKVGDLVIVPYGNSSFRAVAEVTGDYCYEPSAEGYYAHRRAVRWLLKLDKPLPLDTIVEGNFTMRTLYAIAGKRVNMPALARMLARGNTDASPIAAPKAPDQFVLIIDEINRANVSKVFGELITLIEPDKRLGMPNQLTVKLPYSPETEFGVPANLHIIGTMNTADRSIALLDTALRRRFTFREIEPEPSLLERIDGIDLAAVLTTINQRIEYLLDREHRIGHAFFLGCTDRSAVDAVMRDKIIPLLQEYFFEDWSRIHAIVGKGFIGSEGLPCPPGLDGGPKTSWYVRREFPEDAYAVLLGKDARRTEPVPQGAEAE